MRETEAMGLSGMAGVLMGLLLLLGTATAERAQATLGGPGAHVNSVVSVCVNQSNGAMRMLLNSIPSPPCSAGEQFVQWSIQGPQGLPSPAMAARTGNRETNQTLPYSGFGSGDRLFLVKDIGGTDAAISNSQEEGLNAPVGLRGDKEDGIGVLGFGGKIGVEGISDEGWGIRGYSDGKNPAVAGQSEDGVGVAGDSVTDRGVYGHSEEKGGVVGQSDNGNGVTGATGSQTAAGIVGIGKRAAIFSGGVAVHGDLLIDGKLVSEKILGHAKMFRIDDPIDPENKYLNHVSIESSEMMNLYTGDATLDAQGEAVVHLPDWFEALNKDFRYQLTAIGAPGPNLYIAEKVNHNCFKIAGGAPEMEVSWQITGVRHDPWAEANPPQVEEEKTGKARRTYLDPSPYNQPIEKGLEWVENPYFHPELKAIWKRDHQQGQLAKNHEPAVREKPAPATKAAGVTQDAQTDVAEAVNKPRR